MRMPPAVSSTTAEAPASASCATRAMWRMRRPISRVTSTMPGMATPISSVSRQFMAATTTITPAAVTTCCSSTTRLLVTALWITCTSLVSRETISPTRRLAKKPSDSDSRCSYSSRRSRATTRSPTQATR